MYDIIIDCMTRGHEPPEIEYLSWDAWNVEHIAKHGVTRDEVEEAVAGETVAQVTYKNRFLVCGPTRNGRLLAVVIGPAPNRPGEYYTFSARPASRSERRFYRESRETTNDE